MNAIDKLREYINMNIDRDREYKTNRPDNCHDIYISGRLYAYHDILSYINTLDDIDVCVSEPETAPDTTSDIVIVDDGLDNTPIDKDTLKIISEEINKLFDAFGHKETK